MKNDVDELIRILNESNAPTSLKMAFVRAYEAYKRR